jgi:hypothetical protein
MTRTVVHSCALCTTRPMDMMKSQREQLCRCGGELQYHNPYVLPHPMPAVGCAGFQAATRRRGRGWARPETQLTLLAENGLP